MGHLREIAKAIAEKVCNSGKGFTTADVQRHLLKYKKSPASALGNVQHLLDSKQAVNEVRSRL